MFGYLGIVLSIAVLYNITNRKKEEEEKEEASFCTLSQVHSVVNYSLPLTHLLNLPLLNLPKIIKITANITIVHI